MEMGKIKCAFLVSLSPKPAQLSSSSLGVGWQQHASDRAAFARAAQGTGFCLTAFGALREPAYFWRWGMLRKKEKRRDPLWPAWLDVIGRWRTIHGFSLRMEGQACSILPTLQLFQGLSQRLLFVPHDLGSWEACTLNAGHYRVACC